MTYLTGMDEKAINYSKVNNIELSKLCINFLTFLGLACFTVSLFMPVFFTSGEDIAGYWVLITGWIGVIFVQLAWYANPINLLAILLAQEKPRVALLLSILALIIASGTLSLYEIPAGINYEKVFIKEFGLGLYLWLAAHFLVFLALLFNVFDSKK